MSNCCLFRGGKSNRPLRSPHSWFVTTYSCRSRQCADARFPKRVAGSFRGSESSSGAAPLRDANIPSAPERAGIGARSGVAAPYPPVSYGAKVPHKRGLAPRELCARFPRAMTQNRDLVRLEVAERGSPAPKLVTGGRLGRSGRERETGFRLRPVEAGPVRAFVAVENATGSLREVSAARHLGGRDRQGGVAGSQAREGGPKRPPRAEARGSGSGAVRGVSSDLAGVANQRASTGTVNQRVRVGSSPKRIAAAASPVAVRL